jgi:hypothetical protein
MVSRYSSTVGDAERVGGEALALLPYPVGVNGGDAAGRGGGDVGEHRQREAEASIVQTISLRMAT